MITTVATTRATAVPTIPATIGPPDGAIGPLNTCASTGLARARPRATIKTPHHAHAEVMLLLMLCGYLSCSLQPHRPRSQRDPMATGRRAAGFAGWSQSTMLPTELLCRGLALDRFADKVAKPDCCPLHPGSTLTLRSSERAWTKHRYNRPTQNPRRSGLAGEEKPARLNPSRQSAVRKCWPDLHAVHHL